MKTTTRVLYITTPEQSSLSPTLKLKLFLKTNILTITLPFIVHSSSRMKHRTRQKWDPGFQKIRLPPRSLQSAAAVTICWFGHGYTSSHGDVYCNRRSIFGAELPTHVFRIPLLRLRTSIARRKRMGKLVSTTPRVLVGSHSIKQIILAGS